VTYLQIALDGTLDDGLRLLDQVYPFVDVIEIGTPLVIREGMLAARTLRDAFPQAALLADLKIVDAGEAEAEIAFEAGCRWVTVMGIAPDATISGAVTAAEAAGGYVLADLMQVADPERRGRALLDLGCHALCVHTAYDLQAGGGSPLADLAALRAALPRAPLAVAGGIGPDTLDDILAYAPHTVIIGGAITRAANPAGAARRLSERIRGR
jgi:3-hexulose-6-phosphate synthase